MHVQGNPLHLRKFPLHFLFLVFHPQMIQILDIKSNNFEKNPEFLEFFVLLYVSGHFKQKKKIFPHQTRINKVNS